MSFISEISLTIIIALLKLKLHITTFTISSSYAKMKNKNIPYNYYFSPITRFTVSVLHTYWAKHVKSIPLTQERTHTCIEEGQTMQCPKEKGTKGKTIINKTLHRKLDRATRTRSELRSPEE